MNTQTKEQLEEKSTPGGARRLIREVKEKTRKRFVPASDSVRTRSFKLRG